MGLPYLSFLRPKDPLYDHRRLLLGAHLFGLVGFCVTLTKIPNLPSQ